MGGEEDDEVLERGYDSLSDNDEYGRGPAKETQMHSMDSPMCATSFRMMTTSISHDITGPAFTVFHVCLILSQSQYLLFALPFESSLMIFVSFHRILLSRYI